MINSQEFVNLLEQTYGKYPGPAMKIVIANRFQKASAEHLARLYEAITSWYMPSYSQPPTLAHILKYQRELPPVGRIAIEDGTEGYVTPEEGKRFIKDLLKKLVGKK